MKRVAFVLVLGLAHGAYAGDKVDPRVQAKADGFFEKGQAHYQAGEFQAAIELFKDAYELVHDPVYLFNIGQSYRKVLDCQNAYDYYNRYLTDSPNAENRSKVQQWLRELEPCVEERTKEQTAAKRADELEREQREEAARKQQAARTPHEVEVDSGQPYRIAGLALGGAGAVGLAVGIVYGIKGRNLKNDVATACMTQCAWDDQLARDAAGRHANTLSMIGYIGGGVAALAGAGLYVLGRSRVERVMVTPTDGGAAVSAQLRF